MTKQGVKELYMWLTASWPLVIKPGASEDFQTAKLEELYKTYKAYNDVEVRAAFEKWAEENEKFPTTKNIITEIRFAKARAGKLVDPQKRYVMERIYDDGTEYMVSHNGKATFTWTEFVNLPCNPDHIDPEEWERRFKARRKAILAKLYPETPEKRAKADSLVAELKSSIAWHMENKHGEPLPEV